MARTISDEELQLKRRARRRLIGAIVLVTAVVVVLPMVLDSEPRPTSQPLSVQIPSPDSAGAFTSKVVPLVAPESKPAPPVAAAPEPQQAGAGRGDGKAAAAAPGAQPAKEAPADSARQAKPARQEPAKSAAKPKPKPAAEPFVVQVVALADAEKARQLQEKIAAAGIRSYTEVVKTAKGDVTRVRAGPFATRQAAEQAREQLKALGYSGNITTR
ncbi:MAG TPA: SPOR domain-containing protein [Burkholderiales bacterium]|nr:SPOR domain-containing protein [Burkholderiales bacterium]